MNIKINLYFNIVYNFVFFLFVSEIILLRHVILKFSLVVEISYYRLKMPLKHNVPYFWNKGELPLIISLKSMKIER